MDAVFCASCGAPASSGPFCSRCGHPLAPAVPALCAPRRWWFVALAFAALGVVLTVVYVSPHPRSVIGEVAFTRSDDAARPCSSSDPGARINAGTLVAIQAPGERWLRTGILTALPSAGRTCGYSFIVDDVPMASRYRISLGDRDSRDGLIVRTVSLDDVGGPTGLVHIDAGAS